MNTTGPRDPALPARQVALVDLLDRLLAGGVVIVGDVVLSVAGIDLVRISLRALVSSVTADGAPDPADGEVRHGFRTPGA
ncbi:gas vesicle protein [Streptomyces bambusae]|uniref:gas vesicle protein GvpJ n=1 Tax=Streptomyces bambusae TaxID=1550616 RepID=UPI001CFCCAE0|nr:gas vesicle protein GvpJ [Streptomyces bambusae]MCB5164271.1 gas vesicle protein [Streptomyces bambusae]